MRKYLFGALCAIMLVTSANGASVAGFEISPEVGLSYGQTTIKTDADNARSFKRNNYGAFGRIWLGALDIVIAPQVKFDYIKRQNNSNASYSNLQYGASLGYNIGLVVAKLTPYIGANYSSFSKFYKDTVAYNAGLKLKFDLIPISFGVVYTYQKPEIKNSTFSHTMHNIQALLALHF